jgi:Lysylphosphatidylglycerol synthase TM region
LKRRAPRSDLEETGAALLMAHFVVALRWHLILAAETPSGPAVLLKIVWVGLFFNQVLPTGVGGDAVRVCHGPVRTPQRLMTARNP